jgi:hypothetical protein
MTRIRRRTITLLYTAILFIAIPLSYQAGEVGWCETEHHGATKLAEAEANVGTFYVCKMVDFGIKPWILPSVTGGVALLVATAVSLGRDLIRPKVK